MASKVRSHIQRKDVEASQKSLLEKSLIVIKKIGH